MIVTLLFIKLLNILSIIINLSTMKKQVFVALAILFLSGSVMAQETTEKKDSKFELAVNGKLGFARLKQSGICFEWKFNRKRCLIGL